MNELSLIIQLFMFYGLVVASYVFLGKQGLLCWTVLATIAANIEVLVQIEAFGMPMTLGNILFASTFVVTDILSELEGRRAANKAVAIGIAASAMFVTVSQTWLWFTPSTSDFAMDSIRTIFSNTPRLMFTSLIVYAIVQHFDVWLYHKIWELTGNTKKLLWLRNNAATLISQFLNAVLFTYGAFLGVFPTENLWSIVCASYVIFVVTSIADTPVVYLCRKLKEKGAIR